MKLESQRLEAELAMLREFVIRLLMNAATTDPCHTCGRCGGLRTIKDLTELLAACDREVNGTEGGA